MFLKSSISTTKKFFKITLDNVKYLFSGGYQKIPKSPTCCVDTNVSQTYNFYTKHWDRVHKKKKIIMSPPSTTEDQVIIRRKGNNYHQVVGSKNDLKKKYEESRREERSYLVAQKLKELKMLENYKDEQALDIEQVLYYYSRLTCPAYVEIVDKFFMEMYSELFGVN